MPDYKVKKHCQKTKSGFGYCNKTANGHVHFDSTNKTGKTIVSSHTRMFKFGPKNKPASRKPRVKRTKTGTVVTYRK